jgi:hypothetical protein
VAGVPPRERFAAWSLRYLILLAGVDALIGGLAAALPASISNTLSRQEAESFLFLVDILVWPAAIGLSRGYRRARIGVGLDELRAVLRAGMVVVVVCALPVGLIAGPTEMSNPTGALTLYALLKLVAVGTPLAVVLSLVARFLARKGLRRLQKQGRGIRHVVVVGSSAAAHAVYSA